tara:strand:- start:348 stop:668 length:321 start_codon:yes stop_codon:yes gene_type:complete
MKVKDLIEYLTSVDINLEVCIETNQGIFKTKRIYESCDADYSEIYLSSKTMNNLTDEKLNKLLTEEVMDYWLGDATNKQARVNLFCECKYDPDLLESVIDFWKSSQ